MIDDPALREALFAIQRLRMALQHMECCADMGAHADVFDAAEREFIERRNEVEARLSEVLKNMGVGATVELWRVHTSGLE
jgi:hypothetical protein